MRRCTAITWFAFVTALVLTTGRSSVFAQQANTLGSGGNSPPYDMAPETRPEVVQAASTKSPTRFPPGRSRRTGNRWKPATRPRPGSTMRSSASSCTGASIPCRPITTSGTSSSCTEPGFAYHTAKWGPPEKFGYKDFIPMFTQAKFDPEAWATLFEKSGAKYVVPTAQHHDNFSLWDSQFNPYNAVKMGPHRDLIGDLAKPSAPMA